MLSKLYIVYIVITNALGFTSLGCALSWSSPALVKLRRDDFPLRLDNSQISWVASSLAIGAVAIAIPFTLVFNRIGRKRLISIIACIHITGWLILIFSNKEWHLYLGRFVHGLAVGPSYGVIPVYLGEVVGKSIRGSSVAILVVSQSMGALIQYVFSPSLSLDMQNCISIVVPIVFLLCSAFLPESPYYLLRNKREEEAKRVLMRINATDNENDVEEDLENISKCINDNPTATCSDVLQELRMYRTKKILLIITVVIFSQHFSGISAIVAYLQRIFDHIGSKIRPDIAVIISEVTAQATALSTLTIINRVGRKSMLAISTLVCLTAHIIAGSFFYFKLESYVGMAGIMMLQMGYGMGLGTIPIILMSEIMSYNLKGFLSGYYQLVQGSCVAVTIKLFQIVSDERDYYPHIIFAICMTCGVMIVLCIVPETRNKTLIEIQRLLSNESHEEIDVRVQNNVDNDLL